MPVLSYSTVHNALKCKFATFLRPESALLWNRWCLFDGWYHILFRKHEPQFVTSLSSFEMTFCLLRGHAGSLCVMAHQKSFDSRFAFTEGDIIPFNYLARISVRSQYLLHRLFCSSFISWVKSNRFSFLLYVVSTAKSSHPATPQLHYQYSRYLGSSQRKIYTAY